MLYTKSIYKPKSLEDGLRISVMSRHTLNDGKTIDPRINSNSYDVHYKLLAPPAKLVGAYYRNELSFELYTEKYLDYLSIPDIAILVNDLAWDALSREITLLCVEDVADMCHRKILAEECQKYCSALKVYHR